MSRRRGEEHPASKLSDADAEFIRGSRLTLSELAVRFNVSKATISLVRRGLRRANPAGLSIAERPDVPVTDTTVPDDQVKPPVGENLPQVQLPESNLPKVAYPTKTPDIDPELGVTNLSENDIQVSDKNSVYIKRDIDARDDVWTSDMDMSLLGKNVHVTSAKDSLRGSRAGAFPSDGDDEQTDE